MSWHRSETGWVSPRMVRLPSTVTDAAERVTLVDIANVVAIYIPSVCLERAVVDAIGDAVTISVT